jgi:hypothetical protein
MGERDTKMRLKQLCCGSVVWVHPAQNRDWWLVFVNTVMNRWGSINVGAFLD